MQSLQDQVVVITGGSTGFGKEMAAQFYKAGSKVIITSTNEERLKNAQMQIGAIDIMKSDVSQPEDWEKLYKFVRYSNFSQTINSLSSFFCGIFGHSLGTPKGVEQIYCRLSGALRKFLILSPGK